MVDNVNPTSQFHPYQPVDVMPNAMKAKGGLGGMNFQEPMNKIRDFARTNPGKALGALAALAIGAGLMRRR